MGDGRGIASTSRWQRHNYATHPAATHTLYSTQSAWVMNPHSMRHWNPDMSTLLQTPTPQLAIEAVQAMHTARDALADTNLSVQQRTEAHQKASEAEAAAARAEAVAAAAMKAAEVAVKEEMQAQAVVKVWESSVCGKVWKCETGMALAHHIPDPTSQTSTHADTLPLVPAHTQLTIRIHLSITHMM